MATATLVETPGAAAGDGTQNRRSIAAVRHWLAVIAGISYSVFLMYLGVGPLKKTPEDQRIVYVVISSVIMLVVMYVIEAVFNAMFFVGTIGGSFWRH